MLLTITGIDDDGDDDDDDDYCDDGVDDGDDGRDVVRLCSFCLLPRLIVNHRRKVCGDSALINK